MHLTCGILRHFGHFPRFEFSPLPNIVHTRPHAGNANRYSPLQNPTPAPRGPEDFLALFSVYRLTQRLRCASTALDPFPSRPILSLEQKTPVMCNHPGHPLGVAQRHFRRLPRRSGHKHTRDQNRIRAIGIATPAPAHQCLLPLAPGSEWV